MANDLNSSGVTCLHSRTIQFQRFEFSLLWCFFERAYHFIGYYPGPHHRSHFTRLELCFVTHISLFERAPAATIHNYIISVRTRNKVLLSIRHPSNVVCVYLYPTRSLRSRSAVLYPFRLLVIINENATEYRVVSSSSYGIFEPSIISTLSSP
jgi:hypothetical protein